MPDSIPPPIAHHLLLAKSGLPPEQWEFLKASFTKAREAFSPEQAFRIASEALHDKFYDIDTTRGCHCCGSKPKPGCRAQSYRAD